MPTCLVFTTARAIDPLASMVGGPATFWLVGWLWLNFAATYGLGVFDQKLCGPTPPSEDEAFSGAASFVGRQIFLIPGLLVVMWLVATCIAG